MKPQAGVQSHGVGRAGLLAPPAQHGLRCACMCVGGGCGAESHRNASRTAEGPQRGRVDTSAACAVSMGAHNSAGLQGLSSSI